MLCLICFLMGIGIGISLHKYSAIFTSECVQIAGDHSVQKMNMSIDKNKKSQNSINNYKNN